MAIGTSHFALRYFLEYSSVIIASMNHSMNTKSLSANMIEFKDNNIFLPAIHTGMCGKIISDKNLSPFFSFSDPLQRFFLVLAIVCFEVYFSTSFAYACSAY